MEKLQATDLLNARVFNVYPFGNFCSINYALKIEYLIFFKYLHC